MTATPSDRLRAACDVLAWSPGSLSRRSGASQTTAARWLSGKLDPPAAVVDAVCELAAFHALHRLPVRVTGSPPMTVSDLAGECEAIGWGEATLARALGVVTGTVRHWCRGSTPVPPDVAAWLRTLAAFHRAHPLPGPPPGRGRGDDGQA